MREVCFEDDEEEMFVRYRLLFSRSLISFIALLCGSL